MSPFSFKNFIITAATFAWFYAATLVGMATVIGVSIAVYIGIRKAWRQFAESKWYHKIVDLYFRVKLPFIRQREEAKFAVVNVPHRFRKKAAEETKDA